MKQSLPKELTALVDWSVTELGRVIESELGRKSFLRIEKLRQYVKSRECQQVAGLQKIQKDLKKVSRKEQWEIAHAFALMLELINSCEFAYRSKTLESSMSPEEINIPYGRIIHVMTAHPTESRNPKIVLYFKRIQDLLISQLKVPAKDNRSELFLLLKLVWRLPMSKQRKPSVMDEAEYIYNLILQDDIIDVYLSKKNQGLPFYVRTWVGGDKDGHPGVDEITMLGSLELSRHFILKWLREQLKSFIEDLTPVAEISNAEGLKLRKLLQQTRHLERLYPALRKLKAGDDQKVQDFKRSVETLAQSYRQILKTDSAKLKRILVFFQIFPGLVVPLELREDSGLVQEAVKNRQKSSVIVKMLCALNKISPRLNPRFYVRGFVLSQAESERDLLAGITLVKRCLKGARLPVVPLFESAHSLAKASEIVEKFFAHTGQKSMIKKQWAGHLEIMLGYSDSAKESGSLASKVLIQSAVAGLEKTISSHGLIPIFFHGSGGSVERGGGSIQDQTAWWPASALATVKVTIQGEMIYRSYSSPAVLKRQLERFETARALRHEKKSSGERASDLRELKKMAMATRAHYQALLQEPSFLEVIELATPYTYLKNLRIGSRPTKRQGAVEIKNLRAIPWVLCWTQTRTLFPTWWGLGSFWEGLSAKEKKTFQGIFKRSSLLASYIRLLGFTLAKMELNVFALYLQNSNLSEKLKSETEKRFRKEFALCRNAIKEISGESELLWYRPWLQDSIRLRSPLIHPLSALQLIALENKDIPLLRETVTGVASGMLTTG